MKEEQLSYRGSDPGAVQYGNFINYYSFHSPQNRLDNLIPSMFPSPEDRTPYVCLDVGCNSGALTRALHQYLTSILPERDIRILGVDIDPVLIKRAVEDNTTSDIKFENVDIMSTDSFEILKSFLAEHGKAAFDVIFCFSVTMWIHLNHGDDGLMRFLDLIKHNTRAIILEPQPWRCYRTAYRRMKRSNADFPLFKTLKVRETVEQTIENAILQKDYKKIIESSPSTWNRKVLSFHRMNHTKILAVSDTT